MQDRERPRLHHRVRPFGRRENFQRDGVPMRDRISPLWSTVRGVATSTVRVEATKTVAMLTVAATCIIRTTNDRMWMANGYLNICDLLSVPLSSEPYKADGRS
jgi:hypothetical protein